MDVQKEIDQTKLEKWIVIKFEDGRPKIMFNQVNAFEILGIASSLEVIGKNMFINEANKQAQEDQERAIAVAKPNIAIPGR